MVGTEKMRTQTTDTALELQDSAPTFIFIFLRSRASVIRNSPNRSAIDLIELKLSSWSTALHPFDGFAFETRAFSQTKY
jgi:hypothetical protein